MAKLPEDQFVCPLCREITPVKDKVRFVSWIEWGSFSGTPHYDYCCPNHKITEDGYVPGRAYA